MEINNQKGVLYIVATPIGNLEDMSFRAVKILKQVDMIAAEDTRHSKKLLAFYDITTKLVSFHEHNEKRKTQQLISCLKNGLDIAIISNAGTPLISDPGYKLVTLAAQAQIFVAPIPGCNAAVAGLSASGLETDAFLFSGFLPKKKAKRCKALEAVKPYPHTLIFYESPKRVKNLVETLVEILGNRKACLAREITKVHEEYIRGNLEQILEQLNQKQTIKGECTLFVQGCQQQEAPDAAQLRKIICDRLSTTDLGTADLAKQIADQYHLPRKQVYEMILKLL